MRGRLVALVCGIAVLAAVGATQALPAGKSTCGAQIERMGGKDLPRCGVPGKAEITAETVRAWVEVSCADQGIDVAITDRRVVEAVAVLLGATARPAAGGAPSTPHTRSDAPDMLETGGIEPVEATPTG